MTPTEKERLEKRYKAVIDVEDRRGAGDRSLRDRAGSSGDLEEQTPGLDSDRPAVLIALRAFAWIKERPEIAAIAVGGIALGALGIWLATRTTKPRWRRGLDSIVGRARAVF